MNIIILCCCIIVVLTFSENARKYKKKYRISVLSTEFRSDYSGIVKFNKQRESAFLSVFYHIDPYYDMATDHFEIWDFKKNKKVNSKMFNGSKIVDVEYFGDHYYTGLSLTFYNLELNGYLINDWSNIGGSREIKKREFDKVSFTTGARIEGIAINKKGEKIVASNVLSGNGLNYTTQFIIWTLPNDKGKKIYENKADFQYSEIGGFDNDDNLYGAFINLNSKQNNSIQSYDSSTGQVIRTFESYDQTFFYSYDLSKDGMKFVSTHYENGVSSLSIFEYKSGRVLHEEKESSKFITDVKFSSDSRHLIYISAPSITSIYKSIKICDAETGLILESVDIEKGEKVLSYSFSENNDFFAIFMFDSKQSSLYIDIYSVK